MFPLVTGGWFPTCTAYLFNSSQLFLVELINRRCLGVAYIQKRE
jgi:hypothetical protein